MVVCGPLPQRRPFIPELHEASGVRECFTHALLFATLASFAMRRSIKLQISKGGSRKQQGAARLEVQDSLNCLRTFFGTFFRVAGEESVIEPFGC